MGIFREMQQISVFPEMANNRFKSHIPQPKSPVKWGFFLFRVNFRVNNLRKMAGDDGRKALFFGINGSPVNLLQDGVGLPAAALL